MAATISGPPRGPRNRRIWAVTRPAVLVLLISLGLFVPDLAAHKKHSTTKSTDGEKSEVRRVELQIPDLELTSHTGKTGHLLSDFIGQKTVAFTFVYTTCTTICPVIDGIFKNLQSRFEDSRGEEYALLTLTIDSAIDIPARLKEHAAQLGVKPGWDYLTGAPEDVTRILKALEVYTPDISNHPPAVFVVDGHLGNWYRLNGFPSPALIEETMRQQHAGR